MKIKDLKKTLDIYALVIYSAMMTYTFNDHLSSTIPVNEDYTMLILHPQTLRSLEHDSLLIVYNNKIIFGKTSTDTYISFFKTIGLEEAECIAEKYRILRKNTPIVTRKNLGIYQSGTKMQTRVGKYYIFTNISTDDKIKVIKNFCKKAKIQNIKIFKICQSN